jgi:hypothetical protein
LLRDRLPPFVVLWYALFEENFREQRFAGDFDSVRILIASGGTLTANSGKSAELAGLLANARTLENLRSEPAAPFLLRASFTASLS